MFYPSRRSATYRSEPSNAWLKLLLEANAISVNRHFIDTARIPCSWPRLAATTS